MNNKIKTILKIAFALGGLAILNGISSEKSKAIGHSCKYEIGYMCSKGSEYFIDHKWVDKPITTIQ
jgi:hypothetical protein